MITTMSPKQPRRLSSRRRTKQDYSDPKRWAKMKEKVKVKKEAEAEVKPEKETKVKSEKEP